MNSAQLTLPTFERACLPAWHTKRPPSRVTTFAAIVAGVLLIIGCGQDGPPRGEVTGRVTLDGKPLANALVIFRPEGARPSTGITDAGGCYQLTYLPDISGAVVGGHRVMIVTASENDPTEKVPARYNAETELERAVERGSNTFDFALTSHP